MLDTLSFSFTDEQWDRIRAVVSDRLDHDADHIELTRTEGNLTATNSLRRCIEFAALLHILRSASESQTPGYKARIKKLIAMRDTVEALHGDIIDALAPSFTIENTGYRPMTWDAEPLDQTEQAIATLIKVIDASIAAQRPPQTVSSSKTGRDHFWGEMLAIWTGIGGRETGIAAAEFVVAASKPVFDQARAIGGHKTAAGMPQDYAAVVEWLRLRAKSQAAIP